LTSIVNPDPWLQNDPLLFVVQNLKSYFRPCWKPESNIFQFWLSFAESYHYFKWI